MSLLLRCFTFLAFFQNPKNVTFYVFCFVAYVFSNNDVTHVVDGTFQVRRVLQEQQDSQVLLALRDRMDLEGRVGDLENGDWLVFQERREEEVYEDFLDLKAGQVWVVIVFVTYVICDAIII